ncbi:M24 family metallopeptidase [Lysobacter tyrosinilyticus]
MNTLHSKEAVGSAFDLELMRHASEQSWRAVRVMSEAFRPGLRESEAKQMAMDILHDLGMERIWHPVHVRFGANTLKMFNQKSDGDPVLGENDIYFIDIGPVFRGHEGDVGATFTTGNDPDMAACAVAAKSLFDDVRDAWRNRALTGPALYDYAAQRADELGWVLNMDIRGHRVSDFPHAIHRGGDLGEFEGIPVPGVWVLEIQIANRDGTYGAFHEDVLI